MDLFVVDLDEAATDQMGFGVVTFCDGHDLTEGPRDDSFSLLCARSHHCMSFAAAGLPVGEYGPIVTV